MHETREKFESHTYIDSVCDPMTLDFVADGSLQLFCRFCHSQTCCRGLCHITGGIAGRRCLCGDEIAI